MDDNSLTKKIADSYELANNVLEHIPNPLVSIRTSAYNHGPYIKQCIEGVLMQRTNFPFEYIIGEDFSNDETREIVFEYAKKYPNIIRVITADYNVGSRANGRRCIQACRGKYMAICEGDDYWIDPLKLQKQVDFLENHPECSMCFHRCCELMDGVNVPLVFEHLREGYYTGKDILETWTVPTASVVYHNYGSYLQQQCKGIIHGDIFLFLLLAERGKLYCLPDKMSVYRRNPKSITFQQRNLASLEKYIVHYKAINNFFGKKYSGILEKKINQVYLRLLKNSCCKRDLLRYLMRCISHPVLSVINFIEFLKQ